MISEEQLAYVKQQREAGLEDDTIRQLLREQGWEEADIIATLPMVASTSVVPADVTTDSFGLVAICTRAWKIYTCQFWSLAAVYVLALVVGIVVGGGLLLTLVYALFHGTYILFVAPSLVAVYLALLLFQVYINATQIKVVTYGSTKRAPIGEVLAWSWQHLLGFLWVWVLFGLMALGFSMLFVIPGVIVSIWFIFSVFVFAVEDKRGLAALFQSKFYARGHWWGIFGRLLLVFIPLFILVMIPLIGPILVLFYMPFTLSFCMAMYESLREKAKIRGVVPTPERRAGYIAIAIFGVIVLIAMQVIILALGAALQKRQTAMDQLGLSQQKLELSLYASQHNDQYPALGDPQAPDPAQYDYVPAPDLTSYTVCLKGNPDPHSCVSGSVASSTYDGRSAATSTGETGMTPADRAFLQQLIGSSSPTTSVAEPTPSSSQSYQ